MRKIGDNFRMMWIISCVLILIIPILISGITSVRTIRELEQSNAVNNELVVKQIQKEMDFVVSSIFQMKTELLSNHNIYLVSSAKSSEKSQYKYEISQIYDSLRNLRSSAENIYRYFLYFEDINLIITPEGVFDPDEYYNLYFTNSNRTEEQWIEQLQMDTNGYFQNCRIHEGKKSYDLLQYCGRLRMVGQINPPMFCALVHQNYLDAILQETALEDTVYTLAVDQNQRFLLGNSKTGDLDISWPETLEFEQESGYFSTDMNGEKVAVSYVSGKNTGWRYMCVSPLSEFWKQVNWIRIVTVGGLLLSMGCCPQKLQSYGAYFDCVGKGNSGE